MAQAHIHLKDCFDALLPEVRRERGPHESLFSLFINASLARLLVVGEVGDCLMIKLSVDFFCFIDWTDGSWRLTGNSGLSITG